VPQCYDNHILPSVAKGAARLLHPALGFPNMQPVGIAAPNGAELLT